MTLTTTRSPLRRGLAFFEQRFSIRTQALVLLSSFVGTYLAFRRIEPGGPGGPGVIVGATTLLFLFVQLRLMDDIDDLERDLPGSGGAVVRLRRRRRNVMAAAFVLGLLVNLVLNGSRRETSALVLSIAALMVGTPFVVRRYLMRNRVLPFVLYEAIPALIFLYSCVFSTRASLLPGGVAAAIVGMQWSGYEFWKFSRKAGTSAALPYVTSPAGLRAALHVLLALSLTLHVAVAYLLHLSRPFAAYGVALPVSFGVWLNVRWPTDVENGHRGGLSGAPVPWTGLTYPALSTAGFIGELVRASLHWAT